MFVHDHPMKGGGGCRRPDWWTPLDAQIPLFLLDAVGIVIRTVITTIPHRLLLLLLR